jgi:hypothetical protein
MFYKYEGGEKSLNSVSYFWKKVLARGDGTTCHLDRVVGHDVCISIVNFRECIRNCINGHMNEALSRLADSYNDYTAIWRSSGIKGTCYTLV